MRWGGEYEYLVIIVDAAHESGEKDEALEQVLISVEISNLEKKKEGKIE